MPRKNSQFPSDLAAMIQARLEGLGGTSNLLALAGFAIALAGARSSSQVEAA